MAKTATIHTPYHFSQLIKNTIKQKKHSETDNSPHGITKFLTKSFEIRLPLYGYEIRISNISCVIFLENTKQIFRLMQQPVPS